MYVRALAFLKQMALLIFAIILATLSIFLSSHYFMHDGFNQFFRDHMDSMSKVVDDVIESRKKNFLHEAVLLARTQDVEKAFFERDADAMKLFSAETAREGGGKFVTLFDSAGAVCTREDVQTQGISKLLQGNACIGEAMSGKRCIDILEVPEGLALAAVVPLGQNGKAVGALLVGELFKEHRFVSRIKEMTGLEVTVFKKDKRISTTINLDGERAVGTLLNNDEVSDAVLVKGNTFSGNAKIFDLTYKTVYWPIKNRFGKILGMLFIGKEISGFEYTVTAIAFSCLLSACIIGLALSCIGVILFRSVVNPLEKKAYIDNLTGITNREGFKIALREKLQLHNEGAFFLIDLDNFKQLNDTLGHPVGDECLRQTGQALQKVFRDSDLVARLGGDEFTVYAPSIRLEETIRTKAEMLLASLCREYPNPGG